MPSQKSSVSRVVAIDALCGFENSPYPRPSTPDERQRPQAADMFVRTGAPPYDLPDPILYTYGSAIPAAVSVNKELFCGTVGGIQALASLHIWYAHRL
jgi:hypothetical protein